jgi:hypothetical protein
VARDRNLASQLIEKFNDIVNIVERPIIFIASIGYDKCRKPATGMWTHLQVKILNQKIDMK